MSSVIDAAKRTVDGTEFGAQISDLRTDDSLNLTEFDLELRRAGDTAYLDDVRATISVNGNEVGSIDDLGYRSGFWSDETVSLIPGEFAGVSDRNYVDYSPDPGDTITVDVIGESDGETITKSLEATTPGGAEVTQPEGSKSGLSRMVLWVIAVIITVVLWGVIT